MTELFDTEALNPSLNTVSQADLDHYTPRTVEALNEKLPQYEFIELIAVGGMGAVYKARQPKLDRLVAIKLLPMMAHDKYGFEDRFSQEAKAMAKLSHPHIVPIFDFGETGDGQAYFVMEFIEGADMFRLICGGQLTIDHFFSWIPQVCSAIQYAHKQDIVHRDIKPANILIDKEGNVKMADFGLAKLTGAKPIRDPDDPDASPEPIEESESVSMGTPGYAAPEQFDSKATVDSRADIYALGVVMYQMLTGRLPQGAFSLPSESNPHIDIRLDEVVLRAMQEDANDRFQTIGEISERLSAIHATRHGMPEEKKKKEPEIDPSLTPSGKRLITGPVKLKSKPPSLATGRVSTLTGKVSIPPDRVAAIGKPPNLVTGRVATLPQSPLSSRTSTKLRRSIDSRKSGLPGYLIPLIVAVVFLIIFFVVKNRKPSAQSVHISSDQLMDDIADGIKPQNNKEKFSGNHFAFLGKVPTFNQEEAPLLVMRRDGKELMPSGISQVPKNLKPINKLRISSVHRVDSEPFAIALHDDGTLTAWGDNQYGQLEIPKQASANIIDVALGVDHALALTKEGKVIAWGRNTTAQCNVPDDLKNVIQIAATNIYSIALTSSGKVILWGKGAMKKIPARLNDTDTKVTSISAGAAHVYALISDGSLIGWGKNGANQLDEPDVENTVSVVCSNQATFTLSRDGEVTAWGIGTQLHLARNQKITSITAFPDALVLRNTDDQWLFFGPYQKNIIPLSPPSAKMRYALSPEYVFAWPSSSKPAHSAASARNQSAPPSPNPNSEAGKLILKIESEATNTFHEQTELPFKAAISKLNSFYSQALDSAKSAANDPSISEAFQNEIERINSGSPLQKNDHTNIPKDLLSMRTTYLEKLKSYDQDIQKNRSLHESSLDSKLEKLQQEFIDAKNTEATLEVENYRQQRKQWLQKRKP